MKKAILVATIGALTLSANAGDWGKAPVGKQVIEECVDLGGSITTLYATDYIFRGVRWTRDAAVVDVNYTIDGLAVPITIGAGYYNAINGDGVLLGGFDKLDLYAKADLGPVAGFDVALSYSHDVFPEVRSNISPSGLGFGELGLEVTRSLGFIDLAYSNAYAMGGLANGWYHQLGVSKSFSLTDSISLALGAGVAYSDNYWEALTTNDSDWNHYYVTASLPIQLNCRTTLTPYIGYVGAPNGFVADGVNPLGEGPQSDVLHGGLSLSVSF